MPQSRRGRDVDRVVAGPGADDQLQRPCQQRGFGHLGRPHDQYVRGGFDNGLHQRLVLDLGLVGHLAPAAARASRPDCSKVSATSTRIPPTYGPAQAAACRSWLAADAVSGAAGQPFFAYLGPVSSMRLGPPPKKAPLEKKAIEDTSENSGNVARIKLCLPLAGADKPQAGPCPAPERHLPGDRRLPVDQRPPTRRRGGPTAEAQGPGAPGHGRPLLEPGDPALVHRGVRDDSGGRGRRCCGWPARRMPTTPWSAERWSARGRCRRAGTGRCRCRSGTGWVRTASQRRTGPSM